MTPHVPPDPAYEARVRASFDRQTIMATIGARVERVAPGEVDIRLPVRADLAQQHGFLHAGVITTIVDSACGYAALTLMPAGAAVLTVEFKVNLLAPASGAAVIARGRVLKAGRTLTVCNGEAVAIDTGGGEKLIATMTATMMTVQRPGLAD